MPSAVGRPPSGGKTLKPIAARSARTPAVSVACAVAAGCGCGLLLWPSAAFSLKGMAVCLASVLLVHGASWCWRGRYPRVAMGLVLVSIAGLAMAWTHYRTAPNEQSVAALAIPDGRLVRLRGTIAEKPDVRPPDEQDLSSWQREGRTLFKLDCQELRLPSKSSLPAEGMLQVFVNGQMTDLRRGDDLEILGTLQTLPTPKNPGEFDYGGWLQRRGVVALLQVDRVESLQKLETALPLWKRGLRWGDIGRDRAEQTFAAIEREDVRSVCLTMFLGARKTLPEEVRQAFVLTGTAHLLAISGLNVAILAGWWWALGTLLGLRLRSRSLLIIFGLIGYALLTDGSPPVLRATIVGCFYWLGQILGRPADARQFLALAVIGLLVLDPNSLFDVGAQLSFLSVLAIISCWSWLKTESSTEESSEGTAEQSPAWQTVRSLTTTTAKFYYLTAAIWIVTTPLIAARFHLISFTGFLVNVILSPFVTLVMLVGYSVLVCGMVWLPLADLLAVPLEFLMGALLDGIQRCSRWEWGFTATSGPTNAWLAIYYVLLIPPLILTSWRLGRRWGLRLAGVWVVFGLLGSLLPRSQPSLVCTMCSVGHGLAIVLHLPNGATCLFDAGGLGNPTRVAEIVAGTGWREGAVQWDCVVVSHADRDHCNALPELQRKMPIRQLCLNARFLDYAQPVVPLVVGLAEEAHIPIRLISAGQQLQLDPEVRISVLHPGRGFEASPDNAASVVLLVEYAGRSLLLTGDLEKQGLQRLLTMPPLPIDVLQAPHHGSRSANTNDLARWARPGWVLVSGTDERLLPHLKTVYGDPPILLTGQQGAIEVRISSGGDLTVTSFQNE